MKRTGTSRSELQCTHPPGTALSQSQDRDLGSRGDQGEAVVRIYREMRCRVNHVLANPIPSLHESVQIVAGWMHGYPARMVLRRWRIQAAYQFNLARWQLLVRPKLVCGQVCRVEVCLCRIKDHAVDARVGLVRVILDIGLKRARSGDREDISKASVVVERIGIDSVRRLLGGQEEDRARISLGAIGLCCCILERGLRGSWAQGLKDLGGAEWG